LYSQDVSFAKIDDHYEPLKVTNVNGWNVPTDTESIYEDNEVYIPALFLKSFQIADYDINGNDLVVEREKVVVKAPIINKKAKPKPTPVYNPKPEPQIPIDNEEQNIEEPEDNTKEEPKDNINEDTNKDNINEEPKDNTNDDNEKDNEDNNNIDKNTNEEDNQNNTPTENTQDTNNKDKTQQESNIISDTNE